MANIWVNIKKFWRFVAYEDNWQSWLTALVLAFIAIKFILYPVLGLILGTGFPVVAVISESMDHNIVESSYQDINGHKISTKAICGQTFETTQSLTYNNYWEYCGAWYENTISVTKEDFQQFNFKHGFSKGDIIFLVGSTPEKLEIGDTIVFMNQIRSDPIIHRIVKTGKGPDNKYYFQTKGDHNAGSGSFEAMIPEDTILGKAIFRIPWLGYVKIWFVNLINVFR